MRGLKAFCGRI